MKLTVSKKKTILVVIAALLLITLFFGVFYALMFMQDILKGIAGDGAAPQGGVVKFELQKALDIGVVPEE